ncbi:MAG: M50 family metallopeptidase [Patescibacteria group bacterium]
MFTLLIFLAVLAVLVLSHEFGHFIAARKSGMKVYEFGFGFPPRLFGMQRVVEKIGDKEVKKWKYVGIGKARDAKPHTDAQSVSGTDGSTIYSFNLIPLGGFVRIKGEEGQELGPDSFASKPAWQKAITLFAGVAMNVAVAAVLLSIGFMIGLPQSAQDLPEKFVKDRQVLIIQVMSGKPADVIGLKPGDAFFRVGDIENPRLSQVQKYIDEHKNEEIGITIKRGGELIEKRVKPFIYPDTGKGGLGVAIDESGMVSYPWYLAIWRGILATGFYLKEIVLAFIFIIKGLFVGAPVGEVLSGPVGIAVMTGQVAKMGFAYLLNFTALLSLNLAIINILPIPALDGGRLLFLGISKIIRRPFSQKYEQLAHSLGFVLLMLLVVMVTIKDIGNFKGVFINLWNKVF